MKILAIESSCDETSAAVVENGVKVLSCEIFSQIDLHAKTGGVVPEVAAREHVLKIVPVIKKALEQAGTNQNEIEAIAVTRGPGLLSSLIVGFAAAQTLAWLWNKPLIPVHHVAGHIYSNWLGLAPDDTIQFPIMVLTVSGGHNDLVLMRDHLNFQLIGETLDDSAGEAFDKVARMLGLGYPGGPIISKMALNGNPSAYNLPRAMLKSKDYNFSFSGLKTAVLNIIEAELENSSELNEQFKKDLTASFQECVTDILSTKLIMAAKEYQISEIHLAGGVSANISLREKVTAKIEKQKIKLRYADKIVYCTDNSAMIGAAGYFYFQDNSNRYNNFDTLSLPNPNLNLYQILK